MTKDQAASLLRQTLAQLPVTLAKHQELQQAVNVLLQPAAKPEMVAVPKEVKEN